jgi:hypothetical protein
METGTEEVTAEETTGRSTLRLVAGLAAGVVASGVASNLLSGAGYPLLGTLAWVSGYAGVVLVAWATLVRPLDL